MNSSNNPYIINPYTILRLIVKIQDTLQMNGTHILFNSYHRQYQKNSISTFGSIYQNIQMKGKGQLYHFPQQSRNSQFTKIQHLKKLRQGAEHPNITEFHMY